jgi:hypothetical protein
MRPSEVLHEPDAVLWVGDILPHVDRSGGWAVVHGLSQQIARVRADGSGQVPDELREALVDAIVRVSLDYAGEEAMLCELGLAIFAAADGHEVVDLDLRRKYYTGGRWALGQAGTSGSRRRPSPYESLVETCRRRRDARSLRYALRVTGTAGLIIGSMSYGPFANVRGNRPGEPASDIDLLVSVDDPGVLGAAAERLRTVPGIAVADVDRLLLRAQLFVDRFNDGKTILSHKVRLWASDGPDSLLPSCIGPADYLLSIHFLLPSVFEHVLMESASLLAQNLTGSRRTVRDYRAVEARREDQIYTFERRSYRLPLQVVNVEEGYVTSPSVCFFDEAGSYCPGFYQTMLFPPWEIIWDNNDMQLALKMFWRKIIERARSESLRKGDALILPSFAHVRREVLTRRAIKIMDGDH